MRARRQPGEAPEDREPGAGRGRPAGPGSPDASWASTEGPNPLGLEGAPGFAPEDDRPPVAHARDLEHGELYEPAEPEPIEWTPERAAAVIRAGGFLLHHADPLGSEPGGENLWRATEEDALAIGQPLSRILNRYAPARRLAGVSDEAELGFELVGYLRSNLALRGRLVQTKKAAEEQAPPGPFDGAEEQPTPHAEDLLRGPFPPAPPPADP